MTRNLHKTIFKMKNKKAGSYITNYQLVKRIALTALSYAAIGTIGLLTLNNCKKKDPDINHEVNIDGNVLGANYKAWKNGRIIDSNSADSQGDTELRFINKEENTTLNGYTPGDKKSTGDGKVALSFHLHRMTQIHQGSATGSANCIRPRF